MYSNENISYSSQCTHKLLFQIQTLKHLSLSWRPGRGWRTRRCLCFTPIVWCLPHPRPPRTSAQSRLAKKPLTGLVWGRQQESLPVTATSTQCWMRSWPSSSCWEPLCTRPRRKRGTVCLRPMRLVMCGLCGRDVPWQAEDPLPHTLYLRVISVNRKSR